MTHPKEPEIIFLGLCERANLTREGRTNLHKWNVIGLKNTVLSNVYPLIFTGWSIGFAVRPDSADRLYNFQITSETGAKVYEFNLRLSLASQAAGTPIPTKQGHRIALPDIGWSPAFFSLDLKTIIPAPGNYELNLATDDGTKVIGLIRFELVEPPPLSPDRVAAIRSDPGASKAIRMVVGCHQCPSKHRTYTALERNPKWETDGWCWYQDSVDEFVCSCGNTKMDLTILKRNLHGLLGQRLGQASSEGFIPMYEKSSLETLRANFAKLLAAHPREETLQVFLEENPLLLHQFPSRQIFSKPKILNSFVADFGIVTPQKELILVELEKTTTRLMNKNGDSAAPLNHAFDQVRNWFHEVDEHRLAVLDDLGILREDVSKIRGVVIAGRDSPYDAKKLRVLKGVERGPVAFLTYDDIYFSLDNLIKKFRDL